jgi:hypothetical protein
MKLTVTIDELVLSGFAPLSAADAEVLRAAVAAELGRLLAAGQNTEAFWSGQRDAFKVAAGPIHVSPNSRPGELGARIAHALHEGITA